VAGELERLAYDIATRALADQDAAIDEIRTRTGTLLAAVSLVASFLGGRALDASGFTWTNLVAFVAFGLSALSCIYVLFPRTVAQRSLSAPDVYEVLVSADADLAEAHRQLVYWIQDAYVQNSQVLKELFRAFRIACIALALEVAFWVAGLGLH